MIEQSKLGTGRSNLQNCLLLLASCLWNSDFICPQTVSCSTRQKQNTEEDYSSKKTNNRYLNEDFKCYLAAGKVNYLVPYRKRVIPYSEIVKQVEMSCQQPITKQ